MVLTIEKVFFDEEGNSKFTITFEKGDILDITYFVKGIGIPSVSILLSKLRNLELNVMVINDVLVFPSKNDAEKACEYIMSMKIC